MNNGKMTMREMMRELHQRQQEVVIPALDKINKRCNDQDERINALEKKQAWWAGAAAAVGAAAGWIKSIF